ncbi:MAG: FAD-dependent oxidoreductase [Ignavibacteriae bacterium]|nr:FAD-dependent oxidoreductase [Ignavibacteriota bacterium]
MNTYDFDVIVLGGGPAGLTAGIYLSRAKMKTLILTDGTPGGQMILTHEIANYPGVESASGYELSNTMKSQARKFGCAIKSNVRITGMSLDGDIKSVEVNGKDLYTASAVILSPGGKSRSLNVPGESKFKGRGISYCATCDGDFFQDKQIIVVGGGNSALEEAVSLTKYASRVTIVHQFDHFQGFQHAIEEAKKNPRIDFVMESKIIAFVGDESLERVQIQHLATNAISEREVDGVFILIGYEPNTESFNGVVDLNEWKEIITKDNLETNVPGVFAAGDAVRKRYRQITTAVADGTVAALGAIDYIRTAKAVAVA